MNVDDDDVLRLKQMVDAAREIVLVTSQAARDDLEKNAVLLRALARSAGMLGEAAAHISDPFKAAHPEVPWHQITGLRNLLFPEYYHVDRDLLWETARISAPALIHQFEMLLASPEQ